MAEEEKKLSPLAVGAAALASVTSMVVGSLFGDSGTLLGAALSSVTCSVAGYLYEDRARRAHARLRARKERGKSGEGYAARLEDMPLERHLHEDRAHRILHGSWGLSRRIGVAAGLLAVMAGSCVVTLTAIEKATGQTFSSDVRHVTFGAPVQYGTTLGRHGIQSPSPAPSPTASPSQRSTSESPSATPTASPDASPDQSPSVSPDASPDSSPATETPVPAGSGM